MIYRYPLEGVRGLRAWFNPVSLRPGALQAQNHQESFVTAPHGLFPYVREAAALHMGRDSEVREKWDCLGSTRFPKPGDEGVSSGKAAKKSEKNFYWRKDEHGNLFITVTNLFGQDNLRKTAQFFAELGALHQVMFDYHIDYVGEVKAALEKAKAQGIPLDVVAIGPQGSVLGTNIDQRTLGFEVGAALTDLMAQRGISDVDTLGAVLRGSLAALDPKSLEKTTGKLSNQGLQRLEEESMADFIYRAVFERVDLGKVMQFSALMATAGQTFQAVNSDLMQTTGYFISLLQYCGLDAPLKLRKILGQSQKNFERKKLTKSGDEEIFSVAIARVPNGGATPKAIVTINIAYGDLSASIAQALKEMGVKSIIFNGTAGYDVSNPTERIKKEKLKLKIGDIIVPTTMRDNRGRIIPEIHMTSLENIIAVLEAQRRNYRVVSVLGEGSVLKDSSDPDAVTLILSHHGNVDSLLDETSAYMARLAKRGVRSIEIEAAEVARKIAGTGIEYMPLVYISDFPGEDGATFAEGGVEAVSQSNSRRAKDIFTDLVIDRLFDDHTESL